MIEDVRDTVPGGSAGDDAAPAEATPAESAVPPEIEAFAAGSAASDALPVAPEVDFKDRWLRAEADVQNYRRRAARHREEAVTRAEDAILLEQIGVLDDLERALAALGEEAEGKSWAQGVALTAQRLRDLLARWDVREIEAAGKLFDPTVHEALLEIDAPEGVEPGAVAQVALKGYRRGERPLRAARVVVARTAAAE